MGVYIMSVNYIRFDVLIVFLIFAVNKGFRKAK